MVGFYGVDNPPEEKLHEISNLIDMIEFMISFMIRLRNNADVLEHSALYDQLTDVLKTKEGNENNFICNSLERKDYKQYNTGMAMPKLNQEVCKGIPISCPTFAEQKKIGDYFRRLDHLITLHQRKQNGRNLK